MSYTIGFTGSEVDLLLQRIEDFTGKPSPDTFAIYTNATERARFTSAGLLLLNRDNADKTTHQLQLDGNIDVLTSSYALTVRTNSTAWNELGVYSGVSDTVKLQLFAGAVDSNPIKIGARTNTQIAFTVNDSAKAVITTNGDMVIGSTATDAVNRLQVVGDATVSGVYKVDNVRVVSNRVTGWAAATGTADKTTYATYGAPDIAATYSETQVQAIADHVQVLSRHLKALIDAAVSHGLVGA